MSDPDLEQLYALPLAEFTAARDTVAKRLRAEGDSARAAEIKKLRKPTATAWALNQVRRSDRGAVEALLAAGQRLRDAQEGLLAGGERDELAAAVADERRLVAELAELAEQRLGSGASAAARAKLTATLRAVATDEEARDLLGSGTLVRDYESSDFGLGSMFASPARPAACTAAAAPPKVPARRPAVADRRLTQARERLERARSDERSARESLADAERAATAARHETERAAAALREAERALARAERAMRHAASANAASGERVAELEALVLDLEGG